MCGKNRHEQSVRQWAYQIIIEVYRQQGVDLVLLGGVAEFLRSVPGDCI
jgi:hypothetical protein